MIGLSPNFRQADVDYPQFTAMPALLDGLAAAKKAAEPVIGRFGMFDVLAHLEPDPLADR